MIIYTRQDKIDALMRRDLSQLTNMINEGLDVNDFAVPNHTDILLTAINKASKQFFKSVLAKGFRCKNENGLSYLQHAVMSGDLFFVDRLIAQYKKENLNLNEKNHELENCLHVAAKESYMVDDVFKRLTEINISWEEQNNYGHTPLHILLRTQFSISHKLIDILKDHEVAFKIKDNIGVSPLDIINSAKNDSTWSEANKELIDLVNNFK